MEACDIHNKNEIEKFVHNYGGKISSRMGIGLSVERNSSEIRGVFFGEELAQKAAVAVGKKLNSIVPGLVTRIVNSSNSYTVTIPLNEPKLQLIRAAVEGQPLRDFPIIIQEGNQYFVNGEVYPTYEDAVNASGRNEFDPFPETLLPKHNLYKSKPNSLFSVKDLSGNTFSITGKDIIKYDSEFGEILYSENNAGELVMLKSAQEVIQNPENFLEENSEMLNFNLSCL